MPYLGVTPRVHVDITAWVAAHGCSPSGFGDWTFIDDEHHRQCTFRDTDYSAAKLCIEANAHKDGTHAVRLRV